MKIPVAPSGKIFVKISKRFNDELVFDSGVRLFLDTSWKPEWHTMIHGEVVSIPHKMGRQVENQNIIPEVKVGDKAYFHWATALKEQNMLVVGEEVYWVVDYFRVWCVVRDGEVIPVGGKVIVEIQEDVMPEKIGLIYIPDNYRKKKNQKVGKIKWIGAPQKGQPDLGLKQGDTVVFPKMCAFVNEIEGTEYYVMDQDYLDAKLERQAVLDC